MLFDLQVNSGVFAAGQKVEGSVSVDFRRLQRALVENISVRLEGTMVMYV